ncbi:hypothetical protein EGO56_08345 [Pantoea vagans]|nr:hypothetical protein EGO56_08345 [Pantoea vagans]
MRNENGQPGCPFEGVNNVKAHIGRSESAFSDGSKRKAMGAHAWSKASRSRDKNAGSVFEQREALARLRAHLRDEVRNRPR